MQYTIERTLHDINGHTDVIHSFYNAMAATEKLLSIHDDLVDSGLGKVIHTAGRPLREFTFETDANERTTFAIVIV